MRPFSRIRISLHSVKEFIKLESTAGFILLVVAILAIAWANSPWHAAYNTVFHAPLKFTFLNYHSHVTLLEFINDGLMAIFFFLVGLEIKREVFEGELSSVKRVMLPGVAALGGMLLPALIYILINLAHPEFLRGWAIPAATDIAFALAIMSLVRDKIPLSLKVFVTALAIFDDIGAILIIAIFYTAEISGSALGLMLLCCLLLFVLNRVSKKYISPFLIVGALLWYFMLQSGLHPTLAGILTALAIPNYRDGGGYSPVRHVEHKLHPWVAFLIVPLFGLANAGVSLAQFNLKMLFENTIIWGIILALFIGKQFGIFVTSWLVVRFKWAELPPQVNWKMLYGASVVCGIGFTMSLFIGNLAFEQEGEHLISFVKMGVLIGSLISGIVGYILLKYSKHPHS